MSWLRDVLGTSAPVAPVPQQNTGAHKSPWLQAAPVAPAAPVDFSKVEIWLLEKLECIQSAKVLEHQAAHLGYSMADLDAARLAIGDVQVVPCLGVNYWRRESARVLH
jgi:hypothetical protein